MTMDGTEGSGARIVLSPDEGEMVLMGRLGAVMAKYGLEMDMGSIPLLVERQGLVAGEPPA